MANYATLKAAIRAAVRENGQNDITGAVLQSTLIGIVDALAGGYLFKGIASTSTNPGTPDQNVFYLAGPGNYTHFGLTVPDGYMGALKYNGSWTLDTLAGIGGGGGGTTQYLYIRYASNAQGSNMSTTPNDYIGICVTSSSTAPTSASSYAPWFKWKGETGATGAQGPQGPEGPQGPQGPQGPSTITVGTTTTGQPGTSASVSNGGTSTNVELNFTIPAGQTLEMRRSSSYIQWRVVGTTTWHNLIALSEIQGPQGPQGEGGETIAMEQDVDGDIYWWYTDQPSQRYLLADWSFLMGGRIYMGTAVAGAGTTQALLSPPYKADDIYINTQTYDVYQCTAASASASTWAYKCNIKGAQGSPGATGATGPQGPQGPAGASGSDGQRGTRWTTGTAITGQSVTPTSYATGLRDSLVGDIYLNTATGDYYRCTTGGTQSQAKWIWVATIAGSQSAVNNRAGGCGITNDAVAAVADCAIGDNDTLYVELTQNAPNNVLSLDMDFTAVPAGFIKFEMFVYNGSSNTVSLKTRYNSQTDQWIVDDQGSNVAYYADGSIPSRYTMSPNELIKLTFVRLESDSPYDLYHISYEIISA